MNTSFYIAQKLAFNEKKSFSRFIIRIAILAVMMSTAIMIIGSSITRGYQEVIKNKFYDCWGHIHITTFLADPTNMNGEETIMYDSILVKSILKVDGVKSINAYTIQSAILKTNTDIEGILLKGVSENTHNNVLQNYIVKGTNIHYSNNNYSTDLLISKAIADKLQLSVGGDAVLYFLIKDDHEPRARKVHISGIYKTGLEDYDNLFSICDANLINHINQRSKESIHGYEIYVNDTKKKETIEKELYTNFAKPPLQTYLIDKRFENVFSWLGMMKMNERIIILIMLIIAIVNMITALLILVLERTQMVGILKSLGMKNFQIQKIFVFSSMYILSIGLITGTVLGVGLCLLQQKFGFLHLNESIYYVKRVPIYIDPIVVAGINLIALSICTLLLLLPSLIVKTITPTKALQFN